MNNIRWHIANYDHIITHSLGHGLVDGLLCFPSRSLYWLYTILFTNLGDYSLRWLATSEIKAVQTLPLARRS